MDINQYEPKQMSYYEIKKDVQVPKFQRGFVWSEVKQKNFINTLRMGYPFGALLICESKNDDIKYQLVDGLQRLTTIKEYERNPFKFLDMDYIFNEDITLIIEYIKDKTGLKITESTTKTISNSIKECFKNNILEKNISSAVIENLFSKYDFFKGLDNQVSIYVFSYIRNIEDRIINFIPLQKLMMPVVVYKGDKSFLPEIFDRINSSGTQLSKFEIFSATWSTVLLAVDDFEVLNIIDKRYSDMMNESELLVTNYEVGSVISSKEINLFEYAYAIGKIIRENCLELFGTTKSNTKQIDSIGFYVIAGCLGISIIQLDKISDKLNSKTSSNNLVDLKEKIKDCTVKVVTILRPFILTPNGKSITKYIESQVISMICSVFKIRYVLEDDCFIKPRANSKKLYNSLIRNLPKHYIYDIIKEYWGHTGDKKVVTLLSSEPEDNKYIFDISKENWQALLYEWTNQQIDKTSERISPEQRIFINYLNYLTNSTKHMDKNFEFGHIIPLARLKSKFKAGCFSALGNLVLITNSENRIKQGKPLPQHTDNNTLLKLDQEAIDSFYYPNPAELAFAKEQDWQIDCFHNFLKDRHNYLCSTFIKLISNI